VASKESSPSEPSIYDTYEQAVAARLTPTRRKRVRAMSQFILAYGDGQVDYRRIIDPRTQENKLVPLHNVPMHNIIQQVNADYMPETTVNLGDFADMSAVSRFDPDSSHFHETLGPSMQYIHNFYAQMKADNPDGRHIEVDSNHAVRPKNKILRNMPELYNMYRPGEDRPLITYYSLANLGKLGIEFFDGYGAAEYAHGEEYGPPVIFKHGTTLSSVPGGTVRKEYADNPGVNIFRGHGHRDEEVRRTTRDGRTLFYKMLGSSCMNNGIVPGYSSAVNDFNLPVIQQLNHQNTFALIEDFQNGEYNIQTINVRNGKAYLNGKEYSGNE
jgi:hypothetical protein